MKLSAKKLCYMALLTAIALVIFMLEAQVPIPIPGVKLGLANIITVYAIFMLGCPEALCILLVRVLLGSMFAGQMMTLFYSLAGGLLCLVVMIPLSKLLSEKQIWICSIIGAVFHNIGQILVAIVVSSTPMLITYLPVLLISGIIAGLFTGICAQYLINRLKTIRFISDMHQNRRENSSENHR